MTIDVIQSQKPEILLDYVMAYLGQPSKSAADIFKKKYFIVPSHGVGQWLKQKIAERQGISANLQFEALRTFQWSLYQKILGSERVAKAPQMLNMKWKIFLFLSQFDAQNLSEQHPLFSIFKRIEQHCQHFNDRIEREKKYKNMLYWVADQTSRLFANYMIYRAQCMKGCVGQCKCKQNWLSYWQHNQPLNIKDWIRKPDKDIAEVQPEVREHAIAQAHQLEEWQRYIWHEQFAQDFAEMQKIDVEFWQAIEGQDAILFQSKLPQQIYVFMLLELPPSQLYFLRRLAQYISVKIFHYSASQEYWVDSVDPKWKAKYALQYPIIADVYESRHPLLTRLGKQARDINGLLVQLSGGEEGLWQDEFSEELPTNLLATLQTDILYLHEPQANSYSLAAQDQSLQIHVCHSSLRQLEVLKDQLIQWLAVPQQVPRQPSDILILVPNLQDIEPLIRTVFTNNPENRFANLPVKIAGVPLLDAMQLWQAITLRIKLLQQRFTLEEFVDWLSLLPIQLHYGLNFEQIQRITELLQQTGFKRGFDATHLASTLSQTDTDYKFTFRYALNRLALAISMPEHALFNDILSVEHIRHSDFELIGLLIQIYEDLDARRDWLYADYIVMTQDDSGQLISQVSTEVPLKDYGILDLLAVLELEIQAFASVSGFDQVETAIKKLKRIIEMTDAESAKLSLNYLLDEIANTIEHQVAQTEPTGQITFAQMGQLRPLPYRLVVCLNMDTGTFPNRDAKIPFDLMDLMQAELGDRSRLEDDQGAFLDAMSLAQESFWLFYNGFDVNDAEVRDPSSIVQELLHHLDFLIKKDPNLPVTVEIDGLKIPRQLRQLFYVHSLQPYDPKDFIKPEIQRFKDQWFEVANRLIQPEQKNFHWLQSAQLESVDPATLPIVIDSTIWIKELCSPAEHFLKVKGIAQVDLADLHENFEPLQLNNLQRYAVRDYLAQTLMKQTNVPSHDLALLQDKLPVGKMVNATWQVAQSEYELLKLRLGHYSMTSITQRVWAFNDQFNFKITVPEDQHATKWISLSTSSFSKTKHLHIWLEYILWRASTQNTAPLAKFVLFNNKTIKVGPISQQQAQQYVADWLEVWQLAQQQPFVLPPKNFIDYIGKAASSCWLMDDSIPLACNEKIANKMKKRWLGQEFYHSDYENAYNDTASSKHPMWALTVLEDDAEVLFETHLKQYAVRLYQPLTEAMCEINLNLPTDLDEVMK